MSADTDRALDDWSFFTMIADEAEELRRRVQRKLDMMERDRRKDLLDRVGGQVAKLDHDLRQAHNAAAKAAGSRPRAVRGAVPIARV